MTNCTLCESEKISPVKVLHDPRVYYECGTCKLIFADSSFHLAREREIARYQLHINGMHQEGYVKFLHRVIDPSLQFLHPTMRMLDYGCGPIPTLSKLLKQKNFTCFDYDPLFGLEHPHDEYDFIFATECFEHFYYPGQDFSKIDSLLSQGGYLAVMTERWKDISQFQTWYYKRDLTHVSFFHTSTFDYLCEKFSYQVKYIDENRVIILQKKGSAF